MIPSINPISLNFLIDFRSAVSRKITMPLKAVPAPFQEARPWFVCSSILPDRPPVSKLSLLSPLAAAVFTIAVAQR